MSKGGNKKKREGGEREKEGGSKGRGEERESSLEDYDLGIRHG